MECDEIGCQLVNDLLLYVLVFSAVGGKLIRTAADPLGIRALTDVAKEGFDLCGTFYPFHKQAEYDVILGQCGLSDCLLKMALKTTLQIILLCLSCSALGFFEQLVKLSGMTSEKSLGLNLV